MMDDLIQQWRRSLDSLSEPQIDELEDHLREQLTKLDGLELNNEEALTIAAMRCGRPSELAREYVNANPAAVWSRRLMWMVAGYLAVSLINLMVFIPVQNVGIIGWQQLGLPLRWTIALAVLGVSVIMCLVLAVAIPGIIHRTNRGIGISNRYAFLHRWRYAAGGIMLALFLLPWLTGAARIGWSHLMFQGLSNEQIGHVAIAASITSMIIPLAAPLMLWILACALRRHARA